MWAPAGPQLGETGPSEEELAAAAAKVRRRAPPTQPPPPSRRPPCSAPFAPHGGWASSEAQEAEDEAETERVKLEERALRKVGTSSRFVYHSIHHSDDVLNCSTCARSAWPPSVPRPSLRRSRRRPRQARRASTRTQFEQVAVYPQRVDTL
jgi:hypothetical protein